MTFNVVKTTVVLDRPSDWDEWISLVKSTGQNSDIFDLINPCWPAEPPQSKKPAKPLPSDMQAGAAVMLDLTKEQRELFKMNWDDYKTEIALFERKGIPVIELKNSPCQQTPDSSYHSLLTKRLRTNYLEL